MVGLIVTLFALGLAGVVGLAGIIKGLRWAQYRTSVASWGLPRKMQPAALVGLPSLEVVIPALVFATVLADRWRLASMSALGGLVAVLFVGQVAIWRSAKEARCGCFGKPSRVTFATVSRTGLICAVAALLVAMESRAAVLQ